MIEPSSSISPGPCQGVIPRFCLWCCLEKQEVCQESLNLLHPLLHIPLFLGLCLGVKEKLLLGEEEQEGGTVCGNLSTRDRFPGGCYWQGRYTSVIMWPGNERKEENKQKTHQQLEGFDTWNSAEQIRLCPVTHAAVHTALRVIKVP